MTPFTFTDPAGDWERFTNEAERWKPVGFDQEMQLRLTYYLDQQMVDLRAELARRFPKTHQTMTPAVIPFVKHIVREQAKVFLSATKLDLALPEGAEVAPEVETWWTTTVEAMGLALRLKRADAYATLLRTAALRIGYAGGRPTAHVVFPQNIRVVMDPSAPMDIDQAHGVAVEVASQAGISGTLSKRWEFWCARPGEELHGIIEFDSDGKATFQKDQGDSLKDATGRALVPLILFTAHTEELGLFTLEWADLIPTARALNVMLTDIQHIAAEQGFGVMVVKSGPGEKAPPEIVRAPNTAISLGEGADADFINANAPLADLITLVDTRLKQSAVFYGLPAGSVSIEARAAASGLALQIEMRPLMETRTDAIEVYRDPMRRIWTVLRATHELHSGKPKLPVGLQMRWTPGEIQAPADPGQVLDNVVVKLKNRLCTRAEAIAELRGLSTEEAKKVMEDIDAEEPAAPEGGGSGLDLSAKRDALQGDPAAPPPAPAGA